MKYQVLLLPRARKDLDAFEGRVFSRLRDAIRGLAKNPHPVGCRKLSGDEGYRIRMGDYRIVYRVEDQDKRVFIYRVRHRRETYR